MESTMTILHYRNKSDKINKLVEFGILKTSIPSEGLNYMIPDSNNLLYKLAQPVLTRKGDGTDATEDIWLTKKDLQQKKV